jgi:hypothetical protein
VDAADLRIPEGQLIMLTAHYLQLAGLIVGFAGALLLTVSLHSPTAFLAVEGWPLATRCRFRGPASRGGGSMIAAIYARKSTDQICAGSEAIAEPRGRR